MIRFGAAILGTCALACGGTSTRASDTTTTSAAATPADGAQDPASGPPDPNEQRKSLRIVLPNDIAWTPLNPDAGDRATLIAQLWGDRAREASGVLFKMPAGMPGSLHTHTHDYHGVVISGRPTSAQDGGATVTLTEGTYTLQPGGASHANACSGTAPCVLFSQYTGPFDAEAATPVKGAKPHPRHVHRKLADVTWTPRDANNPALGQFVLLWGEPQLGPHGMFVKLPAGNAPVWHLHKHDEHGVVLSGTLQHYHSGSTPTDMPVGSYYGQPGGYNHVDLCKPGGADCILYVYFAGAYNLTPTK